MCSEILVEIRNGICRGFVKIEGDSSGHILCFQLKGAMTSFRSDGHATHQTLCEAIYFTMIVFSHNWIRQVLLPPTFEQASKLRQVNDLLKVTQS